MLISLVAVRTLYLEVPLVVLSNKDFFDALADSLQN
jgi:hypothetical protein